MDHPPRELLVGRESELQVCHDALREALVGNGGVLVLTGEPGIGKTALVRLLQQQARERDMHLLTAIGAWTEQGFPFGVVRQLLVKAARGPAAALHGLTSTAANVLDVRTESPAADEAATALRGMFWLVSNLAETRPVVVVVDDAQWADLPSLSFIDHLALRVRDMPCLVVLTVREPDLGNDEQHALIAGLGREITRVPLAPLQPSASAALVRETLRGAEVDDEVLQQWQTASGGNPFLLHALAEERSRSGVDLGRTDRKGGAPEAVCREVLARLSRLDPAARDLARAVAVLGARVQVRDAAAVAALQLDEAERAADRLTAAGVLAPTRPLSYRHPLLGQAAYADLPDGERASLHRRAADVLRSFGHPAGQAAAHLLASGPAGSATAVGLLRDAARDALHAGLPEAAAGFLQRALDEPPPTEQRAAVLVELGTAQARAALPRSLSTLTAALDAGVPAAERADIALALGRAIWYLRGDAEAALDVLDGIRLDDLDADAALRIRAQRVELRIGWVDGLGGLGEQARADGLRELDQLTASAQPPRPASAVLLGTMSRLELERGGRSSTAARLALDAIAAGEESLLFSSGPDVLVWSEHDEDASRVLDELIAAGRRSGSPYPFGVGSLWRGILAHRTGRLLDAEADCRACVDTMRSLGVEGLTHPLGSLVDVVAERDLAAADELAAQVQAGADCSEFLLLARGRLRAQQGRYDEAVADLRAAEPWHCSPAILPWRSRLASVLARLGERLEAERLARAEVEAAVAQQTPRAEGIALGVLGAVIGGEDGMRLMERAAVQLQTANAPLEQARVLLALGTGLRLARRSVQARAPLRQSLDLARRCGADVLAGQVHQELLASGARPRRRATTGLDALTASELRVARLAAAGLSNREVALELFLSPWTVARHLTNVYGKLAIAGRDDLAAALEADTVRG